MLLHQQFGLVYCNTIQYNSSVVNAKEGQISRQIPIFGRFSWDFESLLSVLKNSYSQTKFILKIYFEASTEFVLRKSTSKKKEEKPCSIYASVECSWRDPIYLSTGKKIPPSLFSAKGRPITSDFEEGTKPFQELRELAIHLDTIRRKIDDVVFELNTTKTEIDIEAIDEKIKSIIQGTQQEEITVLERFIMAAIKRPKLVPFLNAVAVVYFKQSLKKGLFIKHSVQEICDYLSGMGITNAFLKKMSSNKIQKVFDYISDSYAPTTYNCIVKATRSIFRELFNINLNLSTAKIQEGDKKTRCILTEEQIEIVFNEWQKIPPTRGKINHSKAKEDLKFNIEMTKTMHMYIGFFLLQCLCCVRYSDLSKLVSFIQKNRAEIVQQIQEEGCYLLDITTRKRSEQVTIPINHKVVAIVDKLSLDRNLAPFMKLQLKQDDIACAIDSYRNKKRSLNEVIECFYNTNSIVSNALEIYNKNKNIKQLFFSARRETNNNKAMNQHLQKFFSQLVQEGKIEDEEVLTRKKQEGRTIYIKVSKWSIISSHSGRGTWCCNAFKRGLSEAQIIAVSGHRDFKTTYKHYLNDDSKRVQRRLEAFRGFQRRQAAFI